MDLFSTVINDGISIKSLFITPYLLLKDRPEIFAFHYKNNKKDKDIVFIVESGSGGIMGHAHPLKEIFDVPKKIKDAKIYFTIENEYLHSHPNKEYIYYIAKSKEDKYEIFEYETQKIVTRSNFSAGHFHSLKIREVINFTN